MRTALSISLLVIVNVLAATTTSAQKLPKSIHIQGNAMGTSTQLGRSASITIIIQELSLPADQKILINAFKEKGNEGLVNALSKMPSKGRIAITGTLGGDLAYIRKIPMPDGSVKLRLITNRLLRFGEVWADTRSSDYELSAVEIVMSKHKGKSSGTLMPATKLKVNKEGETEIELFQFPWKLVNLRVR